MVRSISDYSHYYCPSILWWTEIKCCYNSIDITSNVYNSSPLILHNNYRWILYPEAGFLCLEKGVAQSSPCIRQHIKPRLIHTCFDRHYSKVPDCNATEKIMPPPPFPPPLPPPTVSLTSIIKDIRSGVCYLKVWIVLLNEMLQLPFLPRRHLCLFPAIVLLALVFRCDSISLGQASAAATTAALECSCA